MKIWVYGVLSGAFGAAKKFEGGGIKRPPIHGDPWICLPYWVVHIRTGVSQNLLY